jgi:hypothetical protein
LSSSAEIIDDKKDKISINYDIPQEVLSGFYGSFILASNGKFLGAKVGEMKAYVS